MEQKFDSRTWLSEHAGRQSLFMQLLHSVGVIEYRTEKGADEWILFRRFRLWHPLTWLVLVAYVVAATILATILYPFFVVKTCLHILICVSDRRVVDCSAFGKTD